MQHKQAENTDKDKLKNTLVGIDDNSYLMKQYSNNDKDALGRLIDTMQWLPQDSSATLDKIITASNNLMFSDGPIIATMRSLVKECIDKEMIKTELEGKNKVNDLLSSFSTILKEEIEKKISKDVESIVTLNTKHSKLLTMKSTLTMERDNEINKDPAVVELVKQRDQLSKTSKTEIANLKLEITNLSKIASEKIDKSDEYKQYLESVKTETQNKLQANEKSPNFNMIKAGLESKQKSDIDSKKNNMIKADPAIYALNQQIKNIEDKMSELSKRVTEEKSKATSLPKVQKLDEKIRKIDNPIEATVKERQALQKKIEPILNKIIETLPSLYERQMRQKIKIVNATLGSLMMPISIKAIFKDKTSQIMRAMDSLSDATSTQNLLSQVNQFRQAMVAGFNNQQQGMSSEAGLIALSTKYKILNDLIENSLKVLSSYEPDKTPNITKLAMLKLLALNLQEMSKRPAANPQEIDDVTRQLLGSLKGIQDEAYSQIKLRSTTDWLKEKASPGQFFSSLKTAIETAEKSNIDLKSVKPIQPDKNQMKTIAALLHQSQAHQLGTEMKVNEVTSPRIGLK